MSILISAPIRTGKTLFVVQEIFKELNKGRMVYTNIVGIKIHGVISVSSSPGDPFDWRDLPNGCVLVWDEAHEHPAFSEQDLLKDFKIDETSYNEQIERINLINDITATEKKRRIETIEKNKRDALIKRKEEIRDIGRSLLLHGHFGIEIYFITQRPAKLNPDVLASVTTHFIMRRKFGMDAAVIWEFGEAMTTWSKSTADIALNKTLWRYPKHLYGFYVSSENHQVRKSFPAKYFGYAALPVFIIFLGFMNVSDTGFFGLFGDGKNKDQAKQNQQVQQNSNQSTETPEQNYQDESLRVASVFYTESGDKLICRAYSGNGDLLKIEFGYCKMLADNPGMLRPASQEVKNERLQAVNYTQYSTQAYESNTSQSSTQDIVVNY